MHMCNTTVVKTLIHSAVYPHIEKTIVQNLTRVLLRSLSSVSYMSFSLKVVILNNTLLY